jgi:RNA polymerase sigma factor (sigma-70 family)
MTESVVYVVDDDGSIRDSMEWLCRSASLACRTFSSAEAFLREERPDVPSCLVLDLRLEGKCGLEILQGWREHAERGIPTIVVTGTGDVTLAVRGMKLGIVDFMEKPADPELLLDRVRDSIKLDVERRRADVQRAMMFSRMQHLTKRERELLKLVCNGLSNKQIAATLNISIKTVANHRASLIAKVRAENTADLVRLAVSANAA